MSVLAFDLASMLHLCAALSMKFVDQVFGRPRERYASTRVAFAMLPLID
jgi:hypothetical protein